MILQKMWKHLYKIILVNFMFIAPIYSEISLGRIDAIQIKAWDTQKEDVEAGKNKSELDKYKALIQQKIQQNVNRSLCGNDYIDLDFEIKLLPSGELLSDPVLTKSSKNLDCDEAIEIAIYKSEPLPVPTDTKLFAKFKKIQLKFYPNGQPE